MATLVMPARRRDSDQEASGDPVHAAARLALVALLLGTVGGFGSLWSLLISPDIRAYNRIAPFIAFFALAAVAAWIDWLTRARARYVRGALWAVILAIGINDQLPPLKGLASGAPGMARWWHELSAFVGDLESRLPPGAAIMQLPRRPYPGDPGVEKMGVYDHFQPYMVSRRLRWSYPALSGKQREWQASLARIPRAEWPAFLWKAGFRAIWIDRAAFPDQGQSEVDSLNTAPIPPVLLMQNHRYIVLEMKPQ
jgi:phosphoglycerol transferase